MESDHNIVNIYGKAGVGKSTLVQRFLETNKEYFPGGINFFSARFRDLGAQSRKFFMTDDEVGLLVVDGLDESLHPREVRDLIKEVVDSKNVKVLTTSRKSRESDYEFKLSPLPISLSLEALSSYFQDSIDSNTLVKMLEKMNGSPLAVGLIGKYLLESNRTLDEIDELSKPIKASGLIGVDGRPLSTNSSIYSRIVDDVVSVNESILQQLQTNPSQMYKISPRKLEEIVATIFITPLTKDGGYDLVVIKNSYRGSFICLIECKRFSSQHKVGVGIVREFFGTLNYTRADAGIIATTSFFTRGAKEFQKNIRNQMRFKDYFGIVDWLGKIQ